jgi:hypothetical protein
MSAFDQADMPIALIAPVVALLAMAGIPATHYVKSDDVHIAYQVLGEGSFDLLFVARVAALAPPGEVLVSQTVRDLVAGSGLLLEDRGTHALKGVPNEWRPFRANLN